MRPIRISAFEDKLVQNAVREVLEAAYEQDFVDCSYCCRPDAARTMQYVRSKGQWMEDEPTGFWRRITSPSSTSFNEDATPRCSGGAKITGPVRNQVTLREAVPSVASE